MTLAACRFFLNRQDYDEEVAHYADTVLQTVLPTVIQANDNSRGTVRSRSGVALPPYLVLERGMPLTEWSLQPRRSVEAVVMVEAVLELIARLHAAGRIHRDLVRSGRQLGVFHCCQDGQVLVATRTKLSCVTAQLDPAICVCRSQTMSSISCAALSGVCWTWVSLQWQV